jgi:hypothetical protein
MKVEVEIEENDTNEGCLEFVASVSFNDCSRRDLEELGKFFLLAAKQMQSPRTGKNEFQVSSMSLGEISSHFQNHETHISVALGMYER